MALPFLSTLTATARFAYPIIQAGVRQGLASRAVATALQEAGLGIRRAVLLDIMRRERTIVRHGLNMRFLPFNRAPNPLRLPTALTKLRRTYSYIVEAFGTDLGTGQLRKQTITIASSKLLTRGDAEALAEQYAQGQFDSGQLEVDRVQLINVMKAGELGTIL